MDSFSHLRRLGDGFWNIRGSFVVFHLLDLGNHMSVVRLGSGKFVCLDTLQLTPPVKQELDQLTRNGELIESAVLWWFHGSAL